MTWLYEYNKSSLSSSAGDDNNDFRMERCHDLWVKKDVGLWVWSICMMYVLYSSDLGTALTIASRNSSSQSSEHCEIRWEKLIFMVIVLMGNRVRKQWELKCLYIIYHTKEKYYVVNFKTLAKVVLCMDWWTQVIKKKKKKRTGMFFFCEIHIRFLCQYYHQRRVVTVIHNAYNTQLKLWNCVFIVYGTVRTTSYNLYNNN